MDKLTLLRTQPVQGHPVYVDVLWNNEKIGELDLPFQGWLKFKRLLEKGLELDARENKGLDMQVKIAGKDTAFAPASTENRAKREGEKINAARAAKVAGNAAEIAKVEEDPELQRDLAAVLDAEASSLREDTDGE